MERVKVGLDKLPVNVFTQQVKFILGKLSDSTFSAINPGTSSALEMLYELETIQEQVSHGNRTLVDRRNKLVKEIRNRVSLMCDWVNNYAAGDIEILDRSGFERIRKRQPLPAPGAIGKVSLKQGIEPGEVVVKFEGRKERHFYLVQVCQNIASNAWSIVAQSTKRSCIVNQMPVGQYSYFRVCAVNAAGKGEWSDVARIMVG